MRIGEHRKLDPLPSQSAPNRDPVLPVRSRRRRGLAPAAIGLLLGSCILFIGGCQQASDPFDRVSVEGTVTLDGEPVDRGMIRFTPIGSTEGPKVALPVIDGKFSGDDSVGPVPGEHRVEVERDQSDDFPHDDEALMQELSQKGNAARRGASRPKPSPTQEQTHTFVAGETNRCEFQF